MDSVFGRDHARVAGPCCVLHHAIPTAQRGAEVGGRVIPTMRGSAIPGHLFSDRLTDKTDTWQPSRTWLKTSWLTNWGRITQECGSSTTMRLYSKHDRKHRVMNCCVWTKGYLNTHLWPYASGLLGLLLHEIWITLWFHDIWRQNGRGLMADAASQEVRWRPTVVSVVLKLS